MSTFRLVQLFISTNVLCCLRQNSETTRLRKLIQNGEEKMVSDLQIDNIVRKIKAIHLYLKMTVTNWDNDIQFRIDHDPSNVIKIDSDDSSSSCDSDNQPVVKQEECSQISKILDAEPMSHKNLLANQSIASY